MDERDERPHAERPARSASDPGQAFGAEPDFARFQPDVSESLLPRWLHLSLLWILGLGGAAALVMAGMFVAQQRKADKALELLAVSARSMDVPVTPAVAPLAEKKPGDMVLLPAAAQPTQTAQTAQTAQTVQPAQLAQAGDRRADAVAQVASPAIAPPTAKPIPPKAASAKALPTKAKQIAKKKKPRAKKATAIARRGKTQTWPRRRGDSITERLNAAVAACRARPHGPGDCNLRACDILGSSDPACR